MTSRTRNLSILGVVVVLLVLALMVILPGTPLSKDTKLGLDLEGGIELVYEARPTPQVPQVTQQAIDDAIETMRKRVDSLGVAEPEIQRAGREQIAVGLPAVQNAERAKAQVGTTARLQFYDWEPNLLTDREIYAGGNALYEATEAASGGGQGRAGGRGAGLGRHARGGRPAQQHGERPLLPLRPRPPADRPGQEAGAHHELRAVGLVPGAAGRVPRRGGPGQGVRQGHRVPERARGARPGGPPSGSRVIRVPEGVVVVEQERTPNQPPQIKRFTVLEDDSELSGEDIKNPEANTDPNTNAPLVSMEFSDQGREAFARVTKRIAERGFDQSALQPGSDRTTSTSSSRSRSTTRSCRWRRSTSPSCPRASTGETAPRSRTSATSRPPTTWPRACASARCRSTSS